MMLIDRDIPVWAMDDDSHPDTRRLADDTLFVMAQEVIHRLSRVAKRAPPARDDIDVEGFCLALMEPASEDSRLILQRAHSDGATHQDLCIGHIGAAAILFGEWWEQDRVSFKDMSVATGRMLHMLQDLRQLVPEPQHSGRREALFAAVPGEQHILGITMAADIMRGKGWHIDLQIGRSETDLCKIARDGAYPIVALSASGADHVRALAGTIVELRLAAPKSWIFVGGHIVMLEPNIAARTGADAAADDMDACMAALEDLYQATLTSASGTP